MGSFDAVNYSLRPAKSIQQQLAFEGVRLLGRDVARYPEDLVYVGLSSVWFTDFVLAHKSLGIVNMVSIERDEIACSRARFNRPFRTVRIEEGSSGEVLDRLYDDEALADHPWLVWLDYDSGIDEDALDDLRSVIERGPRGTILLITFNGHERNYGRLLTNGVRERYETLSNLFGGAWPEEVSQNELKRGRLEPFLARLVLDKLLDFANAAGRSGGFTPAFRLLYADGAPMVTVGGVLPTKADRKTVEAVIASDYWPCMPEEPIEAPPLTTLEALTLQSQHPRDKPLDRDEVRKLGFDLRDDQLRTFARYYRQYPTFARLA